jgi:TonB family protein
VGDLRLRFKLDPHGRARDVSVEEDAVGDEALATCLGRTVESTRFEPAAGGDVEVVARVLLRPPVGLDEARRGRSG